MRVSGEGESEDEREGDRFVVGTMRCACRQSSTQHCLRGMMPYASPNQSWGGVGIGYDPHPENSNRLMSFLLMPNSWVPPT